MRLQNEKTVDVQLTDWIPRAVVAGLLQAAVAPGKGFRRDTKAQVAVPSLIPEDKVFHID